ncbi:hypothetical protein [Aquibacillus saliphilus]|uniref:hypothetical protein n=1 Tax=Aquibacillus saliphilus TaxID=1909422 RepID=UPI001CF01102|nr:hypothetical protein [Aquibacillus saliphilus]
MSLEELANSDCRYCFGTGVRHNGYNEYPCQCAITSYSFNEIVSETDYINPVKEIFKFPDELREKYLNALYEIGSHIRSTPDSIPHIIKTLKSVLPEYED